MSTCRKIWPDGRWPRNRTLTSYSQIVEDESSMNVWPYGFHCWFVEGFVLLICLIFGVVLCFCLFSYCFMYAQCCHFSELSILDIPLVFLYRLFLGGKFRLQHDEMHMVGKCCLLQRTLKRSQESWIELKWRREKKKKIFAKICIFGFT